MSKYKNGEQRTKCSCPYSFVDIRLRHFQTENNRIGQLFAPNYEPCVDEMDFLLGCIINPGDQGQHIQKCVSSSGGDFSRANCWHCEPSV